MILHTPPVQVPPWFLNYPLVNLPCISNTTHNQRMPLLLLLPPPIFFFFNAQPYATKAESNGCEVHSPTGLKPAPSTS